MQIATVVRLLFWRTTQEFVVVIYMRQFNWCQFYAYFAIFRLMIVELIFCRYCLVGIVSKVESKNQQTGNCLPMIAAEDVTSLSPILFSVQKM